MPVPLANLTGRDMHTALFGDLYKLFYPVVHVSHPFVRLFQINYSIAVATTGVNGCQWIFITPDTNWPTGCFITLSAAERLKAFVSLGEYVTTGCKE